MVRTLYKEKVNRIKTEQSENKTSHTVTQKQIGTGVTGAGAALAGAGISPTQPMLAFGGVDVAVAGVALIVSEKGNE